MKKYQNYTLLVRSIINLPFILLNSLFLRFWYRLVITDSPYFNFWVGFHIIKTYYTFYKNPSFLSIFNEIFSVIN